MDPVKLRSRPAPVLLSLVLSLALSLVGGAIPASGAAQPPDAPRGWTLSVSQEVGRPSGWIEVRENGLAGTHLELGRDLGLGPVHSTRIDLTWARGARSRWSLSLTGTSLTGSTTALPGTIFNGSSVAAGSVLRTRTSYSDFLGLRATYQHELLRAGPTRLRGWVGFDYTALTFRLDGTLAPQTVGHELKEDFATQELPVPIAGIGLEAPLGERFLLRASLEGGGLPSTYSFRNEGGRVNLAQSEAEAYLGVSYTLSAASRLEAGFRSSYLYQNEQSREDGNQILLRENRFALAFSWRF